MQYHPHLHVILPGLALSADGLRVRLAKREALTARTTRPIRRPGPWEFRPGASPAKAKRKGSIPSA